MSSDINIILNDNRSGSLTITKRALDLYRSIFKEAKSGSDDLETIYKNLQNASRTLIKHQPNMVLLRRTSNNLLIYFKRLLKSDKEPAYILDTVEKKINIIEQDIDSRVDKIAHDGSRLITNFNKVMTFSNSTVVKKLFLAAAAQKKRFEVYCLKSHPPDEGVDLAEFLIDKGIKTTLISDTEAGIFMSDMNMVMLGADRLFENGFVNKTGTLPLCLTAKFFSIPVYLAVETAKILSESERAIKQTPQQTSEIYQGKKNQLSVKNIYFEKIPLDFVHKVISDEGVFETYEFINWYLKE